MAMVACPALFSAIGFSERETGILIGATMHDVAQVVGEGYAVSRETGGTAMIVKLFRVVLLGPIAFILPMAMAGFATAVLPGFSVALVWSRP
ncbi:putative sulfate exporter family transporter [Zhengella sp. ZM62]|uniref:putative sulfate exporter family transporter n=1 Tax=Zhengella sedimenti TaxID=3390035 RepID=UPI003976D7D4